MAVQPIDTVFQDEDLILRWLPGRTRRLVVVFTGMKAGFGGAPLDEFAGSASGRGDNNVLFVTDKRASWYAAPGLWRRVVKFIRYLRRAEGIEEVITLGTSMGGFGALLLPRDLRVRRAIAFAPQVSMDRSVIEDDRWPDVHKRYGSLPVRNLADEMGETRTHYFVLAGSDCPDDLRHLALIPDDMPRVQRWILPQGRHNLARTLKDAGLLEAVIGAIVRGRASRVDGLLGRYAARVA
ncbi:hypothetical protein [Jannaschia pohangensis]|uniref:Alpha/beta hydrolase n=1 Tax=Jannaschia pohangensis TaxID=390807 RepID=A0A1I3TAU9_9RHOB|nr:hypothetical protein [Jannaschia pohangensis]SFJ68308.1 hypothetical protein SAMN04488095_3374 [Jannaschia pohangensis]